MCCVNQMKATISLPPEDEAKKHCTKLTLNVFAKVDKEEKSGQATVRTVWCFPRYTSSCSKMSVWCRYGLVNSLAVEGAP